MSDIQIAYNPGLTRQDFDAIKETATRNVVRNVTEHNWTGRVSIGCLSTSTNYAPDVMLPVVLVDDVHCVYCGQHNHDARNRGCWACGAPLP